MKPDPKLELIADGVYDTTDAASYLGIARTYLYNMRFNGRGPAYTKRRNRIYYRKADLDTWDQARKARKNERAAAAKKKRRPEQKKAA